MPVGILVLGTGVGMVLSSEGAYRFEDLFVVIGVVVVIVGAVLGPAVFTPTGFKAADTVLVLFAMLVMVLRLGS
jgi:hypothetical protein